MKALNLKKDKFLFAQLVFVSVILILFVLTALYCIVFSIWNGNRKSKITSSDIVNIYSESPQMLQYGAESILNADICEISRDKSPYYGEVTERKGTLYFSADVSPEKEEVLKLSNAFNEIFNLYDFDSVYKENNNVYFSYYNAELSLVYSENNEHAKDDIVAEINDNWYVAVLK